MNLKPIKICFSIFLTFVIFSCVEEIDYEFKASGSIVVVDATINDQNTQQFVTLKQSLPADIGINFQTIKNAEVYLIENDNIKIVASDNGNGIYSFPGSFRAKKLSTYQLKFILPNGNKYSSTKEILRGTPEIQNIYTSYSPDGYEIENKNWPFYNVYIDTKDNPELGDFYNWSWTLFEKQEICSSCDGGRFFASPLPGRCVDDARLKRSGTIYDYFCDKPCWEVFQSSEINAMSDIYSNGNPINGRLVAKIPFYQDRGCLLEVKQQSLNSGAYKYLKLLTDQTQNSGSLVDTPPGALIGNITNDANKFESVGGYFFVSGTTKRLFWLDRKEAIAEKKSSIGLLKGRRISPEPMGMDLTRPPLAPCSVVSNRTSIKPNGWLD